MPHIAASRFDRVFLSEHDRTEGLTRAVPVCGAAAYIPRKDAQDAAKRLSAHFSLDVARKRIGLLVGGPLDEGVSSEKMLALCRAVDAYAATHGYRVLVTTSRRTPQAVDDEIASCFTVADAVVVANKHNFPYVFKGIVALSDFVVATADSVSMISEAASLKPTAIADPFVVCAASRKHDRFVATAVQAAWALRVAPETFEQDIASIAHCRTSDTRERLMRGIKGMF
jgi:mitochondrial fission protein ELM1